MVSFVSRSFLSIDLLIGVGSYETLVGRHVSRGSKEYTQVNGGVGGPWSGDPFENVWYI